MKARNSLLEISQNVQSFSGKVEQRVEKITSSMETLRNISADSTQRMEEMVQGIQEVAIAAQSVSENGEQSSESVPHLEQIISRFKLKSSDLFSQSVHLKSYWEKIEQTHQPVVETATTKTETGVEEVKDD